MGKATGKTSENEGKVWGKLEEMRGNVADEVKSLGRENMGRKLQVSGSLKSKKSSRLSLKSNPRRLRSNSIRTESESRQLN